MTVSIQARTGAALRLDRMIRKHSRAVADALVLSWNDTLDPDWGGYAIYIPDGAVRLGPSEWRWPRWRAPVRRKPRRPVLAQIVLSVASWGELRPAERSELLAHEAAHLLADHYEGPGIGRTLDPHGPEWQRWTEKIYGRTLTPVIGRFKVG